MFHRLQLPEPNRDTCHSDYNLHATGAFRAMTYFSLCSFVFVLSSFFGCAGGGRLGLAGFFTFMPSGNPMLRTGKFIFGASLSSAMDVDASETSAMPTAVSFAFC